MKLFTRQILQVFFSEGILKLISSFAELLIFIFSVDILSSFLFIAEVLFGEDLVSEIFKLKEEKLENIKIKLAHMDGLLFLQPIRTLRMIYYSVMTQANSEKEIPSAPIRSRT